MSRFSTEYVKDWWLSTYWSRGGRGMLGNTYPTCLETHIQPQKKYYFLSATFFFFYTLHRRNTIILLNLSQNLLVKLYYAIELLFAFSISTKKFLQIHLNSLLWISAFSYSRLTLQQNKFLLTNIHTVADYLQ